jgi:hypothetical protein
MVSRDQILDGIPNRTSDFPLKGLLVKEDILEHLAGDYIQLKRYFTRPNLKFRPSKDHSSFDPDLSASVA